MPYSKKTFLKILLLNLLLTGLVIFSLLAYMSWMPSPAYELNENKISPELFELQSRLISHVQQLCLSATGRNFISKDHITPAKNYIISQFQALGYKPRYHNYRSDGDEYSNIIIDIPASRKNASILIVGAHYDSVENSPGANDNASGVAALIEIGRYFSKHPPVNQGLRLIAFANEEPPYFQTAEMGSLVYARSLSGKEENILGMISLETIAYYTDLKGSQKYPSFIQYLYPDTGNFVSFIGNFQSRNLVTESISLFRKNSTVPAQGIAAPAFIPGVGWSDHWSFWMNDYNAIMVTDTAPYRYRHYHEPTDTPDKLNYPQYTKVVYGLYKVIEGLTNEKPL